MNEPRRWLSSNRALSPAERRVLEAGHRATAPAGAKAAVKVALLARLPVVSAAVKAASGPVSVVGRAAVLKFTAVGFALGIAASAVISASLPERRTEALLRSAPPLVVSPLPAPSALSSLEEPVPPAPRVESLPSKAPVARSTSSSRISASPSASSVTIESPQLRAMMDETSRLARARALLRTNDPRAALGILEGMRRDHPRGTLAQERDVLTIEGLLAVGAAGDAADSARDFLAHYPNSPHAATARRALGAD